MSEIDAIQGRIMAALDRIGQGLDALGPVQDTPDQSDEMDQLRAQLEDEKLVNAQLEERVKRLGSRAREAEEQAADAGKTAKSEAHSNALRSLDVELQALRLANQQLRENNAALREANSDGVVEPHLINKSMMAELDGLRATQAAERAEVEAVLAELDRVIEAGGDAPAATPSDGKGPSKSDTADETLKDKES